MILPSVLCKAANLLGPVGHAASNAINAAGKPGADTPAGIKLRKAAQEFEAQLLSSWWQSMRETFTSPTDDSGDAGHSTLDAMSIQAMSAAVSAGGGIGIAAMIVRKLAQAQPAVPSAKDTGQGH